MSRPFFEAMSVEEYLRTEMDSPFRREYAGGFAYPLHGNTPDAYGSSMAHNLIGGNIIGALGRAARDLGHHVYAYQLKLYIASSQSFFYPDLMVTRPKASPRSDHTFGPEYADYFDPDPILLVEIIAEETEQRDKVAKPAYYTIIPNLQTYLIVEQDERRVYAYQRGPDSWTMHEFVGIGDIPVPCLGRHLSLDEVYDGVR